MEKVLGHKSKVNNYQKKIYYLTKVKYEIILEVMKAMRQKLIQ